jgi:glycosyltransferase involved in cell wall biosynthesis
MRLALIAPFARQPKGTTRARVLPLARALAGRGHAVTVLVPPYDHPEEAGQVYCVGRARVQALPVRAALPEQSWRQVVAQPLLAAALVRRALRSQPDVVHVFKPKAVSGLAQLLLWHWRGWRRLSPWRRRRPGPALVLDTDDWEGFGGWNEYEACPWWQKAACDWQERWGLEHADAVTVASRTLETQAWSHRVQASRVVYLPNGLAPEDYPGWRAADPAAAKAALGLGHRPVLLLYTRFFEFPPERVVETLSRVRAALPETALLVVGAGKYGQERQLEALARQRGLGESVVSAGWQPPEALAGLLAAGDVALFPADDNLANRSKCSAKLLEVLWLGKPVVVDRVGQQAEYVQDGVTGLLSTPGDPQSMAEAASRLLRDIHLNGGRALAGRLGEAGRQRVEQAFDWPRLAVQAERAYAAALDAVHGSKL